MLATFGSVPAPATESRWAAETKYDGHRVLVYLPGDGTLVLRSRSGVRSRPPSQDFSGWPEFRPGPRRWMERPWCSMRRGVPTSHVSSRRWACPLPSVEAARPARENPADMLFLRGSTLTAAPYRNRRQVLDGLGLGGPF